MIEKDKLITNLEKLREDTLCGYRGDRCDCKYLDSPNAGSEATGCAELRMAIGVLKALTYKQYAEICRNRSLKPEPAKIAEQWMPTDTEKEEVQEMFDKADADPEGAVVTPVPLLTWEFLRFPEGGIKGAQVRLVGGGIQALKKLLAKDPTIHHNVIGKSVVESVLKKKPTGPNYKDLIKAMTLPELRAERDRVDKEIDKNQGRLTSNESYELDYNLEQLEQIDKEIEKRLHSGIPAEVKAALK